jgi:hypothetical protein
MGKDLSFTWLHFHSIEFIWIYCDKSLEKMKHAIWWLFSIWTLEANVFELVIWIFFVEPVFQNKVLQVGFYLLTLHKNSHNYLQYAHDLRICLLEIHMHNLYFLKAIWKMGTISVKSLTFKCITF